MAHPRRGSPVSVERVETVAGMRARLARATKSGERIGFVPTMGALHRGHGSLIERARGECDCLVASIFVNPLQFDRQDDLDRYPRTVDSDLELCSTLGVNVAFVPDAAEMYPSPPRCTVAVTELGDDLCGRHRPGHFQGMATVVLKLLEIVRPDTAYFGEKDAQQLAIVRRMVRDFNLPVTIVGVPTVREDDGLAMSSRNQRLAPDERKLATTLYRALRAAADAVERGATDVGSIARMAAASIPDDPALRLEYLEIVDPERMQPLTTVDRPAIAAGALWVGSTRLIDNVRCVPPGEP
jgi:pantoate--beta-alanine ligase